MARFSPTFSNFQLTADTFFSNTVETIVNCTALLNLFGGNFNEVEILHICGQMIIGKTRSR